MKQGRWLLSVLVCFVGLACGGSDVNVSAPSKTSNPTVPDAPDPSASWCITTPPEPLRLAEVAAELEFLQEDDRGKVRKVALGLREFVGEIDIHVVVHLLHLTSEGKVPLEKIQEQIRVLNDSYSGHGFQFHLDDVHYVCVDVPELMHPEWYTLSSRSDAEIQAKKSLRRDSSPRLHVYIAKPTRPFSDRPELGWSSGPLSGPLVRSTDGVVIHQMTLPGGEDRKYTGMTLVHEVGHWLGLLHTFQNDGNAPGDLISDTPPHKLTKISISGCDPNMDTWILDDLKDPVHNFMNWVPDGCMSELTPGQAAHIRMMIYTFRRGLLAPKARMALFPLHGGAGEIVLAGRALFGQVRERGDLLGSGTVLLILGDTDRDGRLSREEAIAAGGQLIGGYFKQADLNQDGNLDAKESLKARDALLRDNPLLSLIQTQFREEMGISTDSPVDPAARSGFIEILATAEDRTLSATELQRALESTVNSLFEVADTDGNARLDPAELNHVVKSGVRACMQTALREADLDQDGQISMAELENASRLPSRFLLQGLDPATKQQLVEAPSLLSARNIAMGGSYNEGYGSSYSPSAHDYYTFPPVTHPPANPLDPANRMIGVNPRFRPVTPTDRFDAHIPASDSPK